MNVIHDTAILEHAGRTADRMGVAFDAGSPEDWSVLAARYQDGSGE